MICVYILTTTTVRFEVHKYVHVLSYRIITVYHKQFQTQSFVWSQKKFNKDGFHCCPLLKETISQCSKHNEQVSYFIFLCQQQVQHINIILTLFLASISTPELTVNNLDVQTTVIQN